MAKLKTVKPDSAPAAPAKPPVLKVDQTRVGIRRAVALLEDAKSKLSTDPAAVSVLLNQAIEELTT